MGCDGGTIPKRNEIVKSKQKDQAPDKNVDRSSKWQFCSLSGLPLSKPIVACHLGRLYNKTAIIEYLLDLKTSPTPSQTNMAHVKSLKDVKELNLKEKAEFNKDHRAASGSERFKAQFVCPISGLDMNGTYKFYYLLTCGCVLSERAIKEVPNEERCIICSKHYDNSMDLIVLNGSDMEVAELKEKIRVRRKKQKDQKRDLDSDGKKQLSYEPISSTQSSSSSSKTFNSKQRRDSDLLPQKRLKTELVK